MKPIRKRIMKPLLLQYENRSINNDEKPLAHVLRSEVEDLVWFHAKLPVWNKMVREMHETNY
jgi:hypothetical protein